VLPWLYSNLTFLFIRNIKNKKTTSKYYWRSNRSKQNLIKKMDINSLKSYLATGNKKEFLHLAIIAEGLITFAFVICSFVVGGTANAGFNCVLTGFLNIALVGGSYYVIENSRAPIAVKL
jgi:hypothetical protein